MKWGRFRGVLRVLQYVVGVLILLWIVLDVRWGRMVTLLGQLTVADILALIGVTLVGLVARFQMWNVLIDRLSSIRFADAARVDLVVNFVNQLLPSRLSGRSIAPLVARHYTGMSWSDAVAVAGVHTGLYAVLYAVVGTVGLAFSVGRLARGVTLLVLTSIALYFLAGILVLLAGIRMSSLTRLAGVIECIGSRVPVVGDRISAGSRSLPSFTRESAGAFRALSSDIWSVGGYMAAWLGALLLAPGIRVWLLLSAFGGGFESAILLPFYLIAAYSVTLLPITPGGIGITEATAIIVFTELGVPYDTIVPVIFADRFLGVYLPALSGWVPAVQIGFGDYILE